MEGNVCKAQRWWRERGFFFLVYSLISKDAILNGARCLVHQALDEKY